jgi:SAM-dependent methyltransferase
LEGRVEEQIDGCLDVVRRLFECDPPLPTAEAHRYEVLEHLRRDRAVAKEFYRILRPGGALHLCCPNRLHPRHQAEVLDVHESGGHVRAGYTEAEFRALLEPLGFRIDRVAGLGNAAVYRADAVIRAVRSRLGEWAALPLMPLALPFVWLARLDPPEPFSLYVLAVKPGDAQ